MFLSKSYKNACLVAFSGNKWRLKFKKEACPRILYLGNVSVLAFDANNLMVSVAYLIAIGNVIL